VLIGTGSALPARKVSNLELADKVDTSDEWIVERTGIRSRYIAGEGRPPPRWPPMPRAALAAGVEGSSIDLIVLATATPDQTFPATATIVQDALGANGGIAFDVAAVCSGFLYALGVAVRCCAAAWPAARW
jgi:3-oxoacyl-[acyl-carrier-protein] synthase-3